MKVQAVYKSLKSASKESRNDPDRVMAAVKQNGMALRYASEELRNNREIIMAAVMQNGLALYYLSEELRNNRGSCIKIRFQSAEK